MERDRLWNPNAPVNRTSPYGMYARMRESAPVHRSQSGDYILTRYADIKSILLNANDFRSGNRIEWITRQVHYLQNKEEDLKAITDAMHRFIVMMNPPEHTRLRNLLLEAWDDREVDSIIQENISSLLGNIRTPAFDAVKEFAEPLPVMTMTRIMGLPLSDYHHLKTLATGVLRCLDMYLSLSQLVKIDQHARQFIAYLDDFIAHKEANLSNDLVSKVILQYRKKGIPVSRKELISVCMFLFMAGEETTVNLIGTSLYSFLLFPNEREAALLDTSHLEMAADEALRYDSPVQLLGRIANRDVEVNGTFLKKESTLTLAIGAANRDPEVFTNPDEFNVSRNAKAHLGFGGGIHFCLGSWLAKKQWKMAIQSIFEKFPNLSLGGQPVWNDMLSVRGLTSLKVTR